MAFPLDREIERLAVRTAQINLERLQRAFILFRDTLVIDVRAAVRDIDANLFSLDLERRNVVIAQLAVDQIEADPDRVGLLETQNAIEQLQQAQDGRDSAFRDVQVSFSDISNNQGSFASIRMEHCNCFLAWNFCPMTIWRSKGLRSKISDSR